MNSPDKPTFGIVTLGCKVNQYESQAMREELIRNGFIESKSPADAEFCIVNSCTVTQKADKETRNMVNRFHRMNPFGKVVVAGCYAEADNDRKTLMDIPGVALLVRNSEKGRIAGIISGRFPPPRFLCKPLSSTAEVESGNTSITSFENRNRAFVKVQDGCDHRCSYCKVSYVRGPSKSRRIDDVIKEVALLVGKGTREIVLVGICLGAWGNDLYGKERLTDLVKEISCLDGKFRIRLSSIEPMHVRDSLIHELSENEKICRHLHVPLQSGDDKTLKLMQRPYGAKKFRQIIEKIRKFVPDAAITTDVLVGFPGEDGKRFRNTLEFVKEVKPSRMHVFSYSRREGTLASKFPDEVDRGTVKERAKILTDLNQKLSMDFAARFIGKIRNVVIENQRNANGLLTGYTDNYIRVFMDGPDFLKNQLIAVKITAIDDRKNAVLATV